MLDIMFFCGVKIQKNVKLINTILFKKYLIPTPIAH
ncbi:MAG: hypothetical protein RIR11_873 [Bacteroidota bacterium]|jgi:hypothetical protein